MAARLAKLKAIMDRRSVLRALVYIVFPVMRRTLFGTYQIVIE